MPGSQYIALSGLRAQTDALDRLAADIANIGTAGYKGQREARRAVERDAFDASLQTAIDTAQGGLTLDTSPGTLLPTGRSLDAAIDGQGFFVVQTAAGVRYTRNGHFGRAADGTLTTSDGATVLGADGPIQLGTGETRFDADGSVWSGGAQAGRLSIVNFTDSRQLAREGNSLLRADGLTAAPVAAPAVRAGMLEESNVSVAERLAELTSVARGFEALQKSISVMMNDVDGRAIDQLGRRSA